MTDKQILQKAIEKAEKNGFDFKEWNKQIHHNRELIDLSLDTEVKAILLIGQTNELIFNHDFAKAFWKGDTGIATIALDENETGTNIIEMWRVHLQSMVLCEEPLKYLEKFL